MSKYSIVKNEEKMSKYSINRKNEESMSNYKSNGKNSNSNGGSSSNGGGFQVIKFKICLYISILAVLGIVVATLCFPHNPPKEIPNISDVNIEEIRVGNKYNVDFYKNYGCIWETSALDFTGLKRTYTQIFLVSIDENDDKLIGIMIENDKSFIRTAIDKAISGYVDVDLAENYVGKIREYDSIMTRITNENIEKLGLKDENIEILPYYINTCHDNYIIAIICLVFFLFVFGGMLIYSIYLNKKGRTPDSEVTIFIRDSLGNDGDCYGKQIWHSQLVEVEKNEKYEEYMSIQSRCKNVNFAFRKYYILDFLKFFIMGLIATYLVLGFVFSYNPHKWYFMFYGIGFVITCVVALGWIIALVYEIIVCFLNPVSFAIKSYIKNSKYPDEYLKAYLSKGDLVMMGRGFMYLTSDFLITGNSYRVIISRFDNIYKISWCEKEEIYGHTKRMIQWIRFYDSEGNFGDVYVSWGKAVPGLLYLKSRMQER